MECGGTGWRWNSVGCRRRGCWSRDIQKPRSTAGRTSPVSAEPLGQGFGSGRRERAASGSTRGPTTEAERSRCGAARTVPEARTRAEPEELTTGARMLRGRRKKLIEQQYAVRYNPSQVWRILRELNWSCQRPTAAAERNEEAIGAPLQQ